MQCGECRESEGGKERRENKMFEFLSQAESAGGRVGILLFIPHHPSRDLFKSQRRPEPALPGPREGGQSGQNTVWSCVDKTRKLLGFKGLCCIHLEWLTVDSSGVLSFRNDDVRVNVMWY